jgi:hypothetical protein
MSMADTSKVVDNVLAGESPEQIGATLEDFRTQSVGALAAE